MRWESVTNGWQPGSRRRPSTDYFPAGIFNAKSVSCMSGIPAIVKKKKKPNPASIKVFIVLIPR